ncbi:cytochrome P450 [Sistotremastrum suecicum HHB10207 ss-3]|uniref:Cytochrome P450 n=1 Tax=Sistotremastrum suecicum HHB10207 ss-3 TaxID=1314776 RepID=A0A166CZB0_9AGAM|nr:cytochrome P450 [Sistotremastrum suecicum HHB10207 ss-3]
MLDLRQIVRAAILLVVILLLRYFRNRKRLPLPPGPKAYPLIGNVLDMPKSHEWHVFHDWGSKYGDVVYASALGQDIIILNSHQAAIDILIKKSAVCSDRPEFTMGKLVGWDQAISLLQYDRALKTMRRSYSHLMGSRSSTHFWEVEEQMTKRFIKKVYNDIRDGDREESHLQERIRWTAGAIVLRIAYGYTVAEEKDPFTKIVGDAMDTFSRSTEPGAWIVDFIPPLRHLPHWFPFVSFHKIANEWRGLVEVLGSNPLNFVKAQMTEGTAPLSFTRELLRQKGPGISAYDEHIIKWAANGMYTGGSDTTVSAVYSFFLAMTLYPDVQKRAHAELDKVLRGERLPNLQDRQNHSFPYVDALVKEVIRWAPVLPASIPHVMRREEEYRGWRIPKGSYVISNLWGITRNADMYPNPNEFRPERFLLKSQGGDCETANDIPLDPSRISFGYGRRNCPGQHLAELSIWISAAMSLAVFDIKAIEGHKPSAFDYETGVISHPKPFKCDLHVRSLRAEALLEAIPDHDVTVWMNPQTKRRH